MTDPELIVPVRPLIPPVVYHGTRCDVCVASLDFSRLGETSGDPNTALGLFFTDSRETARSYGASVVEVELDIHNPYETSDDELNSLDSPDEAREFRAELQAEGYDGIIADVTDIYGNDLAERWYVVFSPEQIRQRGLMTS